MAEFKFPTETIELPSKGLIYPETHPLSSGTLEMKYMTAKEEDILSNQTYIQKGIVLDKLLQSLIVNKDIEVEDLVVGDKNALLVAARVLGYGKNYEVIIKGQEHTVEVIIENTVASTTTLFNWRSSQVDRTILGHVPYSNGTVYYDVAGFCSGANRVNYTPSPIITNRLVHYIFRCRTSATPYREIIENTVSQVDSGGNSTDTLYFSSNVALIGAYNEANLGGSGGVWQGKLYAFRMYTSALTDAQILQNYNAQKLRFGY